MDSAHEPLSLGNPDIIHRCGRKGNTRDRARSHSFGNLLCCKIVLIAVLNSGNPFVGIFRLPLLRFLGIISYSLYLFHTAVAGMLRGMVFNRMLSLEMSFKWILLSLVISISFASFSYFLIELNFLKLGRSKSYDKVSAQSTVSRLGDVQQAEQTNPAV